MSFFPGQAERMSIVLYVIIVTVFYYIARELLSLVSLIDIGLRLPIYESTPTP